MTNTGELVGKGESSFTAGNATVLEISMENPQGTKSKSTQWSIYTTAWHMLKGVDINITVLAPAQGTSQKREQKDCKS